MNSAAAPLPPEKQQLLDRSLAEQAGSPTFRLPLHLDLTGALSLVGCLQLALRHPGNTGPTAEVCRQIIDGIIERMELSGYPATAELARLGDNPEHDVLSALAGHTASASDDLMSVLAALVLLLAIVAAKRGGE